MSDVDDLNFYYCEADNCDEIAFWCDACGARCYRHFCAHLAGDGAVERKLARTIIVEARGLGLYIDADGSTRLYCDPSGDLRRLEITDAGPDTGVLLRLAESAWRIVSRDVLAPVMATIDRAIATAPP